MQLGSYSFPEPVVFVAPMAGVTDRPFRQRCHAFGASATVAEMIASKAELWTRPKFQSRLIHHGEPAPRIVQLLGNEPETLALAAQMNVAQGAEIIDFNLGCPAKKVCRKAAGSALLADVHRVRVLLRALRAAVTVPITVKMRLGVDRQHLNAVEVARIAEDEGVALLTVHGRTRACGYRGTVNYAAIAEVCAAVRIPVLANGDITSASQAAAVLQQTGAAGVMIGRAAQGQPWLPGVIRAQLAGEAPPCIPQGERLVRFIREHLDAIHRHYGAEQGVRMARKHIAWYSQRQGLDLGRHSLLTLTDPQQQRLAVEAHFAVA